MQKKLKYQTAGDKIITDY